MEHYIKFVCDALFGNRPNDLYARNEQEILKASKLMHEKYPVSGGKIFRGILLRPNEVEGGLLRPVGHIKYLSFTSDRDIAYEFADVNSQLSSHMMRNHPDYKGYLIEHTPEQSEILFHHSWIDVLGLDMHFEDEAIALFKEQREVILKQRMLPFKLQSVS